MIADDVACLKAYLHSDFHLKDWMAAVKPHIKGIVVFDSRLKVPLDPSIHQQLHPVLFRLKDTVNAGKLQLHVEKFNGLDGISASLEPFLGQKFLDLVSWPDKSEGFNWCLTVLARDAEALRDQVLEHALDDQQLVLQRIAELEAERDDALSSAQKAAELRDKLLAHGLQALMSYLHTLSTIVRCKHSNPAAMSDATRRAR